MRILALAYLAMPAIIAQATPSPSPDPWGLLLSYGAAAPFAGLCFWMLRQKDKELEKRGVEIAKVTELGMTKVVPALTESSALLAEVSKTMEAASVLMHQLVGRGLDQEAISELRRALRDNTDVLRQVERILQHGSKP